MTATSLKAGRFALRRVAQGKCLLLNSIKGRKKSSASSSANSSATVEDGKTIPTPNSVAPFPLWQRLGPVSTAFGAYARSQRNRPYWTQFGTSLVIYFCGDLAAQSLGDEDYNPWRTMRNVIIGGTCSIPAYKWFIYLGESFNYTSKILSLGTKVVVNQIVFTPLFNSYFFGMQSMLSGDGPMQAWERIKQTVPISFINSCKLWPAITAFSFTYILPQYRALFAGCVAVGWQSYLSWLNRHAEKLSMHFKAETTFASHGRDKVLTSSESPKG